MQQGSSLLTRIVAYFADSKLTPLIIIASLLLGLAAVIAIPREEEPQIIVPMVDVLVRLPGASPAEMERRVTAPLEQLLWEIPGVEYLYSISSWEQTVSIVRFKVGEDAEDSLVKLQSKLMANFDRIPPGVDGPLIKPRSIDDVPILSLTFHGADSYELRKVAADVRDGIKQAPNASEITLIGGDPRQLNVELDLERLAGYGLTPLEVARTLGAANQRKLAGDLDQANHNIALQAGQFLRTADDVGRVVLASSFGAPVYLRDVATVYEGPEAARNYVEYVDGPGAAGGAPAGPPVFADAVTLALAKRQGTNAIHVVHDVLGRVEALRENGIIPPHVKVEVTRDYGETSNEKANELLLHMLIAVVSVTLLIAFVLGWREAGVVAMAIPVTLALTMFVFHFIGFTLNRITLFALIFSIGILVDDPIVDVENIVRHFRLPQNKGRHLLAVTIEAVNEVRSPLILATFAVMAAILPMAFVRGLMGPYMRPIPIGASAAMFFSMVVAFIVTPWTAYHVLARSAADGVGGHGEQESKSTILYRKIAWYIVTDTRHRWVFIGTLVVLLLASVALVPLRAVKVKMLPFDNKSEFQVIINMPEGTSLERTHEATRALAARLATDLPEVRDLQLYVGTAGPYNFNGLVRHYFMRQSDWQADIQVNLVGKGDRKRQSHDVAKAARELLEPIAQQYDIRMAVAEVPPGPPVLQTLVAEVFGPDYDKTIELAQTIKAELAKTPGVVDVDIYTEGPRERQDYLLDSEKAGLHGISAAEVADTLAIAADGLVTGLAHDPDAAEDVPIEVRLRDDQAARLDDLGRLRLRAADGSMVELSSLTTRLRGTVEPNIYRKNLQQAVFVTADMAGEVESPVYAILGFNDVLASLPTPDGRPLAIYQTHQPPHTNAYAVKWDGEWHITYEVFRDLGIAFAAVIVLIYALVVGWFHSFITPLVIMSAIPFSLVGILPAHWLGGVFFSATSMIGFIAGAGIVVRNSIILVDFINHRLVQGMPLEEAVVDAGAVRFRPMLLTALALVIGTAVILLDPIFQGLAVALMFGEVASLFLSRMAVPVFYYMVLVRQNPRPEGLSWEEPDWDQLHEDYGAAAPPVN